MNISLLAQEATHEHARLQNRGEHAVISSFGNVSSEYAAIRGSVGIFDFSTHGKFRITGDEHVAWVSRLVSLDLEFLNSEKAVSALCLNEAAEVLAIVTLYKYDDSILIETESAERDRLAEWFAEHQEDGIEIADVSDTYALIGLEGPHSFKVVQTLIDFEISSVPFQGFVETNRAGHTLLLSRTGYTGEYGYKVFVPAEIATDLWRDLYNQVLELGGAQCGNDALEITMLEVRQPIGRIEASSELQVNEAGLGWLIDFQKTEDYIGRDSIEQLYAQPASRRTIGFTADKQASIQVGDAVVLDGQTIGTVLVANYSLTLDATLGLAINNEPFTVPGLSWGIQSEHGAIAPAQSISSPYIIPKSWKVKML